MKGKCAVDAGGHGTSVASETTSHLSRANHLSNDDFQFSPVHWHVRSKRTLLLSHPGGECLYFSEIDEMFENSHGIHIH